MNQDVISVLLVDDHPVVRAGYRRLLDGDSAISVVAEAGDGDEGYRLYKELSPDVVIMDLNMPGISGLEAARKMIARDPGARVLVFSVHDNEAMLEQALKVGVRGYLTKRSAPETMLDAVHRIAAGRTYIDDALDVSGMGGAEDNTLARLSPREFEVFQLLSKGHSVAEIADLLVISPKTVGVHHTRIMQKLEINNRAQLVRIASRYGIGD